MNLIYLLIVFAIVLSIIGFVTSSILLHINRKKGICAIIMFTVFVCVCLYYFYMVFFCEGTHLRKSVVSNITSATPAKSAVSAPVAQPAVVQPKPMPQPKTPVQAKTQTPVSTYIGTGPCKLVLQVDDSQEEIGEGKTLQVDKTSEIKILSVQRNGKPTGLTAHVLGLAIHTTPAASKTAVSQTGIVNDTGYEFSSKDFDKNVSGKNRHMYKISVYSPDGKQKICDFFLKFI